MQREYEFLEPALKKERESKKRYDLDMKGLWTEAIIILGTITLALLV